MNDKPEPIPLPPKLRLKLWLGKSFGYLFVPERYVQVIYRMGQYHEVRGPGVVRYDDWTETLGPLIFTGARNAQFDFSGIISRDNLPVSMRVNALLFYDPRNSESSIASSVTRLPDAALTGIAEKYFLWLLSSIANRYAATELVRADVRAQIEHELRQGLIERMGFFGLTPGRQIKILSVELPKTLAERNEQLAQRRANILAGLEFEPEDSRRALVTEVIERMGELKPGDSFVNFGEMFEAFVAQNPLPARRTKIVDQPPPPRVDPPAETEKTSTNVDDDEDAEPKSRL